jgi:hypothetical protein
MTRLISRGFSVGVLGFLFLSSVSAEAHLKVGKYQGKLGTAGESCEIEIKAIEFPSGVRHPLNERVRVVVNGVEWVLSHAPSVSEAPLSVQWDSSHLTGAQGTREGAFFLSLEIDHTEGHEGPSQFVLTEDYRDAGTQDRMSTCQGLSFNGSR